MSVDKPREPLSQTHVLPFKVDFKHESYPLIAYGSTGTTSEETMDAQIDALVKAVAKIDAQDFTRHQGTFENEISSALIDSVYSMQARYYSKNPKLGVFGRLRTFREEHPEALNDLNALVSLGAVPIRKVMGNTKSAGRYKSDCVIDAANALLALDPAIVSAEDAHPQGLSMVDLDTKAVRIKRAYTSVRGLGQITANYFLMHMSYPRIKPDVWIERFVTTALTDAGIEAKLGFNELNTIVEAAFKIDSRGAESLQAYDHAIWLQGAQPRFNQ